jgi:hypothetical protein
MTGRDALHEIRRLRSCLLEAPTMRTLLALSTILAGACADMTEPITPSDFLTPSLRTGGVGGLELGEGVAPPPSCITRYELDGIAAPLECRTSLIDGDPRRFVTLCPENSRWIPIREEVDVDSEGRVSRHLAVRGPTAAFRETFYLRDELGRLTGLAGDSDADGQTDFTFTYGDRDARGNPLSASITQKPVVIYDQVFPATARSTVALQYDADDRLIAQQSRFVGLDGIYYDMVAEYDDVARRRNLVVIVDGKEAIPISGGAGYNTHSHQFDVEGRLVETQWLHPGDRRPNVIQQRYDEQGRLLTRRYQAQRDAYTAHSIYDCP